MVGLPHARTARAVRRPVHQQRTSVWQYARATHSRPGTAAGASLSQRAIRLTAVLRSDDGADPSYRAFSPPLFIGGLGLGLATLADRGTPVPLDERGFDAPGRRPLQRRGQPGRHHGCRAAGDLHRVRHGPGRACGRSAREVGSDLRSPRRDSHNTCLRTLPRAGQLRSPPLSMRGCRRKLVRKPKPRGELGCQAQAPRRGHRSHRRPWGVMRDRGQRRSPRSRSAIPAVPGTRPGRSCPPDRAG